MRRERDKLKDEAKDFSSKFIFNLFKVLLGDHEFQRSLRSGRIPRRDELNNLLTRAFKRQKEDFDKLIAEVVDQTTRFMEFAVLYEPILEAVEQFWNAETNFKILKKTLGTNFTLKSIGDALRKILEHTSARIRTESICLECSIRWQKPPFHLKSRYSKSPQFFDSCPQCDGKTVLNTLFLEISHYFASLINENIFPELIVGFSLAQIENIRNIYVHKVIHSVIDGQVQKGHEVDVTCFTDDDKLILVEVTTSVDLNEIMEDIDKKTRNFEEKKISYNCLIYVTPAPILSEYLRQKRVRILGAKHLSTLPDIIQHLLKEEIK